MLVCEMFLWKGRTYGYSVSNAVTGLGWEIITPGFESGSAHFEFLSVVIFSYRYYFL
jgi:hypothetical protein